jgi:hypothetical protein
MSKEIRKEQELPPLDFHGHGYPNCDCDLPGGDEDCEIQPPFVSAYDQREEQLREALRQLKAERAAHAETRKDKPNTREISGSRGGTVDADAQLDG